MLTNDEYRDTYLALNVCINARVPVILWGPPGQGKTSVIQAIAEREQRALEVLLASIREPQDFAGLPSITNGRATLVAPDWAQRLSEDGNGILFMDEVNTAPPAVQAALLRVSLDKVAGDCHLGERTSIVAAANPPEQAADGWDLAPPLANRFCHLEWSLPAEVVRNGLSGEWPAFTVPAVSQETLQLAISEEKAIVGGFLTARPDLTTVLPSGTADQGRAFPTPRSWNTMLEASAWVTASGLDDSVRRMVVRGCLGPGASAEYLTYRQNMDLPQPEQVLQDPSNLAIPKRADLVFVIGAGVLNAVRNNLTADRWHAAGEVLEKIATEGHPDIAVSLARGWLATRPKTPKGADPVLPNLLIMKSMVPLMTEARLI